MSYEPSPFVVFELNELGFFIDLNFHATKGRWKYVNNRNESLLFEKVDYGYRLEYNILYKLSHVILPTLDLKSIPNSYVAGFQFLEEKSQLLSVLSSLGYPITEEIRKYKIANII